MNMPDPFWTELWKFLGWGAALLWATIIAAGWVASRWLDRRLKHYEAMLQRDTETMKAVLDRLNKEHEVRFSLLHGRRAELIADLWEKIRDAYAHTLVLAARVEREMDLELSRNSAEAAWDAVRTATDLLQKRKIWLSNELSRQIDGLLRELFWPSFKYHYYLESKYSAPEVLDSVKEWAGKNGETEGLIEALEQHFRSELSGMAPPNKALHPTAASAAKSAGR